MKRGRVNELAAVRTIKLLRDDGTIDQSDHALAQFVVSAAEALDRELERAAEPEAKTYTVAPAQRVYLAALTELGRRVRVTREVTPSLEELFATLADAEPL